MKIKTLLVILLGYTLLMGCVFTRDRSPDENKVKDAETKVNLQTIQIALERYAIDNSSTYPYSAAELIDAGIIAEFPLNAYTGEKMHSIQYDDTGNEGDFTYIPVEDDAIHGYYLIAYGRNPNESMDLNKNGVWDNAILVLDGYTHDFDLPDIKDLL